MCIRPLCILNTILSRLNSWLVNLINHRLTHTHKNPKLQNYQLIIEPNTNTPRFTQTQLIRTRTSFSALYYITDTYSVATLHNVFPSPWKKSSTDWSILCRLASSGGIRFRKYSGRNFRLSMVRNQFGRRHSWWIFFLPPLGSSVWWKSKIKWGMKRAVRFGWWAFLSSRVQVLFCCWWTGRYDSQEFQWCMCTTKKVAWW